MIGRALETGGGLAPAKPVRLGRRFLTVGAAVAAGLLGLSSLGAERPAGLAWTAAEGHRSAGLAPVGGRTGFVLMDPGVIGVQHSNRLDNATVGVNRILENGSGVALGDVDGDGWCDIYLCSLEGRNTLLRNAGGWRFEDVTAASPGLECSRQWSTGAVLADVDGDVDLDLLVNRIGGGTRLFLNDGRGRFTESIDSGLSKAGGATSMALADVDGDRDLDLYVTHYRTTNYKDAPPGVKADVRMVGGKLLVTPEDRFTALASKRSGGVVLIERGEMDLLYLNDGKGHFSAVSWTDGQFLDESGQPLTTPPLDWGLSVLLRDLNGDGAPDIYVCNDFFHSRDRVWMNEGNGRFRAQAPLAMRNMSMSSMSVDAADVNRDGHDDLFVGDMLSRRHGLRQTQRANVLRGDLDLPVNDWRYAPEVLRNTLYLNRGNGTYAEIAQLAGVEASEWTWNGIFIDVDLDGFEDLLIANGNNHDVLDADTARAVAAQNLPKGSPVLLQFPGLATANLAFRNRGDLTFEEVGHAWGFDTVGISHGMALGDLDNDGDLDVVVNNLNSPAGLYRNESAAPRIAVRLKGEAGNSRGIGARIRVVGGPCVQTQEMIAGGRYASGDDAMRTFAAGNAGGPLRIEVTWRSGRKSIITQAAANRVYEMEESHARVVPPPPREVPGPLFEDASALLQHVHVDEPFNDQVRQPLLTHRLGSLGPGLTWADVDDDGWEDLLIAGGRGGQLAAFRNDRKGGFARIASPAVDGTLARDQTTVLAWKQAGSSLLLVGSSNYEDGLTNGSAVKIYDLKAGTVADGWRGQFASVGPLAMGDIDGDGDLDLFAGARALPGRYPEPAASRLYRNEAGRFRLDVDNSRVLLSSGMTSAAVFSDLDLDGDADLVLACDWGPVRVFRNEAGRLTEATAALGLEAYSGRWNSIGVGDFDGDGRLDLIGGNWGRNTRYQRYLSRPIHLVHGEFNGDGQVQTFEAYHDPELKKVVPWVALDVASTAMPWLLDRFASSRDYAQAGLGEILGERGRGAREFRVTTLDSMVFLNRGSTFEAKPLPTEAQMAPVFGVTVADFDGDGHEDLFLAQNFFDVELELSRYDGGVGLCLRGDGKGGWTPLAPDRSGVVIHGQQRGCAVADFDGDGRTDLVVGQNGAATRLFRNVQGKPGLRVRLEGPAGNPAGVGASIRLGFGAVWGPRREIHAGSGYWSQDAPTQVLGTPSAPDRVEVSWPGAAPRVQPIPTLGRTIVIPEQGAIRPLPGG